MFRHLDIMTGISIFFMSGSKSFKLDGITYFPDNKDRIVMRFILFFYYLLPVASLLMTSNALNNALYTFFQVMIIYFGLCYIMSIIYSWIARFILKKVLKTTM